MAAVGELFLDCILLSLTLSVIGCAHSGSLNDEISTGQLLSSLKTVESSSVSLPPLTMLCMIINISLCVSWYVVISALNTVILGCDWSHSKWSWWMASSSNTQSQSTSMWLNTAAAIDWRRPSLCHDKQACDLIPCAVTLYYVYIAVFEVVVYSNSQANLESYDRYRWYRSHR